MDGTFLDNAQKLFDTARADDSTEPKDFALIVRPDGGLHFVMESPFSLEAAASYGGARIAYRVTKASGGGIRVTGRSGNLECTLEQSSNRQSPGQLLRDQPLYWISSPLTISAPS